ncbi:unnamed protein product [Mycena citricolor]|uniref:CCHC-type domain-containing protein n=1 Tax=Mycena citricolor TaxID=2018698 RepID=A0AAD2HTJ2_9AGAR|nr:unnamed protein product [Mycena citricolor]
MQAARRIATLDEFVSFVNREGITSLGSWIERQRNKNIPQKYNQATRRISTAGVTIVDLRSHWQAQLTAQVSLQSSPPVRVQRELGKIVSLQNQIEDIDDTLEQLQKTIDDRQSSNSAHIAIKDLQCTHSKLSEQAVHLYTSLDLETHYPELAGLPFEFVQTLLLMRDLKIQIRKQAIGTFLEWENLDRAVQGRREPLGTKLHQAARKALSKRQPTLHCLIDKFNSFCSRLEEIQPPHCSVPIPLPLPTKLNELKSHTNLFEDIWITPSDGGVPLWLCDENVRQGISSLHVLDRCHEEDLRLSRESENMLRWIDQESLLLASAKERHSTHESTISYRFPSSSGSPSPPPIVPSSPDLAHQNQPGPSDPYLALPPPEDEIPDLDELPSEQPPSPPPHTPAPTMSGHHRITLAANPPYFDGDKSKYLGFVDACTTYIGAYRSEFSQDETKILFVLSYLRNENGTSCAASRWAMNWKQHNFDGFQGLKAGVTSKNFLEEFQRAFGDSNAEQVAAARLMALRQNKRSFADYISDFEMLAADAGYNVVDTTDDKGEYKKGDQDNILIEFLERGLSSEIASRLYNTGVPLPKAYGAFKAWCINIEANALRDQLRKASYGHPTQRPPPQFRPQTAPVAPTPAPARPAANEPVPMEIDRTHARGRNIICYNCQQPGHIARNCPEPRKKRTFFNRATMLEEIENGDKDNEFLKEIAEKLREKGF